MSEYALEMKNITKIFPGVKALSNVNFAVKQGEIHCLVGENGAGKSTLMKVLSGIYPTGTYSGSVLINGEKRQFRSVKDSEEAGLAIINQELELFPELSIYENIFFGHEIMAANGITINWTETIRRASELLQMVGLSIDPSIQVKELGVGQQQMVEIAKAISLNAQILVLDEPTAALNEVDCEKLFELLRKFKAQGITSVMITHKLKEVIGIADTVTVLRDGKTICTLDNSQKQVDEPTLIRNMVGREIGNVYPKRETDCIRDEVVMELRNWTVTEQDTKKEILHNIDFKLHKGEIVGIAGLIGAGRTELALSIFGNTPNYKLEGQLFLNGEEKTVKNTGKAIRDGIAYVSEDRKKKGLILIQDIKTNITAANLSEILDGGVLDLNKEIVVANTYKKMLEIKAPSVNQTVLNLSGGNQQKVSVAKWMFADPGIMILDEPTRGIDVGAKHEIYTIMNDLVAKGMSIILISSDLLEVLGMSDRIYAMNEGRIAGEFTAEEATEELVMAAALNYTQSERQSEQTE